MKESTSAGAQPEQVSQVGFLNFVYPNVGGVYPIVGGAIPWQVVLGGIRKVAEGLKSRFRGQEFLLLFRGLEFSSQHPHGGSQPLLGELMPLSPNFSHIYM